jgi:hypothetical protein
VQEVFFEESGALNRKLLSIPGRNSGSCKKKTGKSIQGNNFFFTFNAQIFVPSCGNHYKVFLLPV